MLDFDNKLQKCNVCKHEYTSIHTEVIPGVKVYVCDNCLEAAKHNFIWICMGCGTVYIRNKKLVIERITDNELKRAYLLCQDKQIIQGIDMCIKCDPEGILNYMDIQKVPVC
ncbi:MAG TPA: hypothetical protein ENG83_15105 [Nitrospirae bacterium]|nr:hypothetical protein BMS3Abin06_00940 [bacterium BMS3Abin06]HDH13497.1 hypothetical protein [Nitrospirota bacterium]HDZ01063.1 hypothetical protein [Nitrospirota bacterium]